MSRKYTCEWKRREIRTRGRETNDRKMQPEKNDTDERVTDEQGRETVAVAGGNDSGNGAEEP